MTVVVNRLATLTAHWVRPGCAEWDPSWVAGCGRTRTKDPDLDQYGSFVRAELLGVVTDRYTPGVPGVLAAITEPGGGLRVVFDPALVAGADGDEDGRRVLDEALSRLISVCAKHGFEVDGEPAAW